MSTKTLFQAPYLRTSRSFPPDIDVMTIELNKAYIDVANCVNLRTIGIFSSRYATVTGESWFFEENRKQQSIRQIFTFTTTANITHNLNFEDISRFTSCYGDFTDGPNWYGLIFGTNIAIAGQISFYITPTQIVFAVGGGAPAITQGIIVLEWLSNV